MNRLRGLLLDLRPLRLDRDYRLVWSGQLLTGVGRQVTIVALPYQLYVLTGSPLSIGALAIVQLVPLLLFSLAGGAIADAMDRRRLLFLTTSSLAATSAVLAILATLASPPILLLYLVAFVAATISAFDQPARSSIIPRIVPTERLAPALALNQVAYQGSAIAGPVLAGVLIATVGLPAGYALDVVTFAVSLVLILAIRPIRPLADAARPGFAAVVEGLRFAWHRPVILSTFAIDLDAMIFGMPAALFPVLALGVFHAGPAGVGLLAAAPAAGALLGALLTGWVGRTRYQGRAVIVAVAIWGIAITAFGLSTFSFGLALVFLAIAGAADMISAVFRSTILQSTTPDELRGRLSALHLMVVVGGPRVGDVEASAVAAAFGAQLSVVSGGVLCLLGLVAVAWQLPQLAAYDARAAVARPAVEPPGRAVAAPDMPG